MKDLSTRRLKRYYWKHLRDLWYDQTHPDDWPNLRADRIANKKRTLEAVRAELEHRGLWLP